MRNSVLLDAPITAIHCTNDNTVYFSSGNVVYRTSLLSSDDSVARVRTTPALLPSAATVRCVAAPPSAAITTVVVASPYRVAEKDSETASVDTPTSSIIFMGAADHLLASWDRGTEAHAEELPASQTCLSTSDAGSASASCGSCVCLLHTDESRILRIAVDERRGCVLVVTASNDFYRVRLATVESVLRGHGSSGYADLSQSCSFDKWCGPPLGVVLAADIMICSECDTSETTAADAQESEAVPRLPYCLFAATYSGEVVEWCPRVSTASPRRAIGSATVCDYCVVSRVQAHPSGCAIFSVRATRSRPLQSKSETNSVAGGVVERTHLVTSSDDRTVALYERCGAQSSVSDGGAAKPMGSGWALLWRGSGGAFSKSRVFDAAVCAVWSMCDAAPPLCSLFVAAAGEDGCVQVHRIARAITAATTDQQKLLVAAEPWLVRSRQHRGHGAYRVAFRPTGEPTQQLVLVSGGFDGTVLAHVCPTQRLPESAATARSSVTLDTATLIDTVGHIGQPSRSAEESVVTRSAEVFSVAKKATTTAAKTSQVRVVHVDSLGQVLACTSAHLCVRFRDSASVQTWCTPLPHASSQGRGPPSLFPAEPASTAPVWGLPATAESFSIPLSARGSSSNNNSSDSEKTLQRVFCAVVGTTTGIVYTIPYVCTDEKGCLQYIGNHEAAEEKPDRTPCTLSAASFQMELLTALQEHGKITQMAVLAPRDNDSAAAAVVLATNHVRGTVALSALHTATTFTMDSRSDESGAYAPKLRGVWQTLSIFTDCPGPLTTALALTPASRTAKSAMSFWVLIGDKAGCLVGSYREVTASELAVNPGDRSTLPTKTPVSEVANVHEYVFAEHLHIAVTAVCVEASVEEDTLPDEGGGSTSAAATVLRVAGTGGVLEFRSLPQSPPSPGRSTGQSVLGEIAPTRTLQRSLSKEPLRLPFEVSAVLAMSASACVVQCGTTVSVLYRIPRRTSWVLVDTYDDIRAPRLLTARISKSAVFVAHCSDGHTVEVFSSFPDSLVMQSSHVGAGGRTSLLHGGGLPGKDYNCVALAPPPFHCLLMGNEDSSLVVYPLPLSQRQQTSGEQAFLRRGVAPLNICGAHHSNILAIAVLPQRRGECAGGEELRFVSVGGGAMVNLWSSDAARSPLRLVDWWCGGLPAPAALSIGGGSDNSPSSRFIDAASPEQRSGSSKIGHSVSSAAFQKKRGKQAAAASPASSSLAAAAAGGAAALTERIARFMCVTAWEADALAVGSSDGTLLFFRVRRTEGGLGEQKPDERTAMESLELIWQGPLNAERPKPILCATSTADVVLDKSSTSSSSSAQLAGSPLVVAGDTNGVVYVVDGDTHRVLTQMRLEQSAVNALSELHRVVAYSEVDAQTPSGTDVVWRFAAVHDSGVVHLLQVSLTNTRAFRSTVPGDEQAWTTKLNVLSSASTGLTAGRSVRWPAVSQPLVVVTEERVTQFDPVALVRGELVAMSERRVNVRCVSGAVVVPSALAFSEDEALANSVVAPQQQSAVVAVVGQGFEVA